MSELNYSVEHIGLASRDPASLKEWYVSVLDARVEFDNGKRPPVYFLRLSGGPLLEIYPSSYEVDQTADNTCRGWRHLALSVRSLDEAKLALMNRGVMFPDRIKPATGGGAVLFFNDPEGNLIHLVERFQKSEINPAK